MARSIIVTGGFGILGHAVAEALVAQGAQVARIDFAPAPHVALEGTLDLGGVDLSDAEATEAAVKQVAQAQGGIDALINIAGGFTWETVEGGSLDSWARMNTMNLVSNVTITKLALPFLKTSAEGRIVNIGAGGAIKAGMGMAPYAASKAGVHRLTEALAEELADTSITVNAILPSIIDTPTNRADMPNEDFSKWVQPSALADVISFLISPAAKAITGALIPVTRGS